MTGNDRGTPGLDLIIAVGRLAIALALFVLVLVAVDHGNWPEASFLMLLLIYREMPSRSEWKKTR